MRGAFGLPSWAWAAALAVAAAIYAALLARSRRFETEHLRTHAPMPWWAGYARDGSNLVAAGLYIAGFRLAGFAGPPQLVLGVALLLFTYGLDWLLGKRLAWPRASSVVVVATAAIGLALTFVGAHLQDLVSALVEVAQPR